jgi:hypothetical protein
VGSAHTNLLWLLRTSITILLMRSCCCPTSACTTKSWLLHDNGGTSYPTGSTICTFYSPKHSVLLAVIITGDDPSAPTLAVINPSEPDQSVDVGGAPPGTERQGLLLAYETLDGKVHVITCLHGCVRLVELGPEGREIRMIIPTED